MPSTTPNYPEETAESEINISFANSTLDINLKRLSLVLNE